MPELKLVPLENLLSKQDREKLMQELQELNVLELPAEEDDGEEIEEILEDEQYADFLDRLDALDIAATVYLPVAFDGTFDVGDHTIGSGLTLLEALEEPEDDEDEDELILEVIGEQIRHAWTIFSRAAASCVARQLPLHLKD